MKRKNPPDKQQFKKAKKILDSHKNKLLICFDRMGVNTYDWVEEFREKYKLKVSDVEFNSFYIWDGELIENHQRNKVLVTFAPL